jgi:hypothetical protein
MMWTEIPIRRECDIWRTVKLCDILIDDRHGKMLGDEIKAQVGSRYIKRETYERLSRWVHPKRDEPKVQPVAENLSYELLGFMISRVEE